MTRILILSTVWMFAARVTAWIGRRTVRELGRHGLVAKGWDERGKLKTAPARPRPSELAFPAAVSAPDEDWPECTPWTVGMALGGHGGRAEA